MECKENTHTLREMHAHKYTHSRKIDECLGSFLQVAECSSFYGEWNTEEQSTL